MTNTLMTAIDNKDWTTAEALVTAELRDDDATEGLVDWLADGDWTTPRTAQDVAREWQELNEQSEGVDY